MNDAQTTAVRITRQLSASPDHVFDAWVDPKMIPKWMLSPSPGDEMIHVKTDARVGGRFSFLLRRAGQEIDHFGDYVELARPRRLVFTFDARLGNLPAPEARGTGSLISIDFVRSANGTEVRLTADRIPLEHATRAEAGWSRILDAITRALGS